MYRESSIIGSNKYRAKMLAENETFTNHHMVDGKHDTHVVSEKDSA
jgi:hypothetical protein